MLYIDSQSPQFTSILLGNSLCRVRSALYLLKSIKIRLKCFAQCYTPFCFWRWLRCIYLSVVLYSVFYFMLSLVIKKKTLIHSRNCCLPIPLNAGSENVFAKCFVSGIAPDSAVIQKLQAQVTRAQTPAPSGYSPEVILSPPEEVNCKSVSDAMFVSVWSIDMQRHFRLPIIWWSTLLTSPRSLPPIFFKIVATMFDLCWHAL